MVLQNALFRIGIDLGGTKIEAVSLTLEGKILVRERVPTPHHSYEQLLESLRDLVIQVEKKTNGILKLDLQGTVGIGIPGSIAPGTEMIRNANLQIINGKNFGKDLEKTLSRPVKIENDANCFALSEAIDGAGQGAEVVFGVIIGTGCGGGLVLNKKIWRGPNAIAGEWGHNRLPDPNSSELPGPPCYCGHYGCIETFVSGTGLRADYQRFTGIARDPKEIVELAEKGDQMAEETLKRLESRLARSLAVLINQLDPEVIVFGGGLSNLERLYDRIPKLLGRYIFGDARYTKLRKAIHGDSSGVRGAAWLWN
jgi:fructokinase